MKKPAQRLIAEVPRRHAKVEMTIGIDLGDVWSHYCTLNPEGTIVDRGRFRTTPKAIEKWFTDLPPARIAMEAGTHSIWISEQLQELGHEVIVANVRELRAISHSDRKSDHADAEKLARFARLDPQILRPHLAPHSPTAGSPYADQSSRFHGPAAHCVSERGSWTNEGLRPPDASVLNAMLCQAQPRSYAARTIQGTRSGARADRADDTQDQAVRSADSRAHADGISRDA